MLLASLNEPLSSSANTKRHRRRPPYDKTEALHPFGLASLTLLVLASLVPGLSIGGR